MSFINQKNINTIMKMNKKLILRKIISGGQQGADFGGLLAGKELNLETGGTAPKEHRTENGSNYKLIDFGLKEHSSVEYPPRTKQNVQDSDGTIIFGRLESPGSILTYNLCKKFNKPYWFVSQVELIENKNANKESFILWLIENQIQILNVAGNRESTNSGIEQNVKNYLVTAIRNYFNDSKFKFLRSENEYISQLTKKKINEQLGDK